MPPPGPQTVGLRRRVAALVILGLATAVAHLLGQLGPVVDLTSMRRHEIPSEAAELLKHLESTAAETPSSGIRDSAKTLALHAVLPEASPLRERVSTLHQRYVRHAPDLALNLLPPEDALASGMRGQGTSGDVRLSLGERSARVRSLDDSGMLAALLSLSRPVEPFVVVALGHGNRRAGRTANHDLSEAVKALEGRGLTILEFDLSRHRPLPNNAGVVLIASPRLPPEDGTIEIVRDYLDDGGNVILLQDPTDADWVAALGLPVTAETGTIIDPASQFRHIDDPAFVVVDQFPAHPLLEGFDLPLVFPHARPLSALPADGADRAWTAAPLFQTHAQTWQEKAPLENQVAFNPAIDRKGPLIVGMTLERPVPVDPDRRQRVVLVGDGDWLSNAYLGNGGNLMLAERLIEWLLTPEFVASPTDVDANFPQLALGAQHPLTYVIATVFLLALPLGLLLIAFRIWRQSHA